MLVFRLKTFFLGCISCFILSVFFSLSYASVTMNGTRVIYQAKNKSVDVNLRNKSDFPYVIQVWFDDGDMSVGPTDQHDIPFFSSPAIFKIQPNSTQIVRISFTNTKQLPQDRESVFYFNFLEIPPSNVGDASNSKQNKMLVMLRNRVKLFYRPDNLQGSVAKMHETLQVKRISNGKFLGIDVTNSQPYYASLSQVTFLANHKTYQAEADMIPPFSSKTFFFNGVAPKAVGNVNLTLINDQGGRISKDYSLGISR